MLANLIADFKKNTNKILNDNYKEDPELIDDLVDKLFVETLINYSLNCELDSQWRKERDSYVDSQLDEVYVD